MTKDLIVEFNFGGTGYIFEEFGLFSWHVKSSDLHPAAEDTGISNSVEDAIYAMEHIIKQKVRVLR